VEIKGRWGILVEKDLQVIVAFKDRRDIVGNLVQQAILAKAARVNQGQLAIAATRDFVVI